MKRTGSPIIKIAAATSMVVFSLSAAFAGSIAWFNSVSSLAQGANDFKVEAMHSAFKSLTIFPSIDTDRNTMYFDMENPLQQVGVESWNPFTPNYKYNNRPTIALGEYDLLEPSQPVLAVIDFSEDVTPTVDEPIHIRANSSKNYYLGSVASIEGKDDVRNKYPLSSVVACYTNPFNIESSGYQTSSHSVTRGNTTTTYSKVWSLTYANRDSYTRSSFVRFDTETTSVVEGPHFDQNITVYKATSGTIRSIAMVIDYYGNAIDYVFNNFLGLEEMDFACDWTTVI